MKPIYIPPMLSNYSMDKIRDELGATGQRLWTVERVVQERERREGGERQKTKE